MSKVFVDISVSLDGFIAGPNGGPHNPLGDGGDRLHQWMYDVETWRERQSLTGGQINPSSPTMPENPGSGKEERPSRSSPMASKAPLSKSSRTQQGHQDCRRREHLQAVLRSWTDRRTADPSGPHTARRWSPIVRAHRPGARRTGKHASYRLPQGHTPQIPRRKGGLR